ncbi:MAG: DNA polymerase III subunit gamma/tau [Gammaproteobacteria bacterium]|nr:DNA polymerase III subunit gamma/tau [Gammaproteobacteria bacterium]
MSYLALARKWRPKRFTEMVGQEHVLRALTNALDSDRVHHAYLFTGTRGVGKTTIARILSKCLNCERGVSSAPCGECAACREIDEGRFVDLIEVDAASRTKVEETRELLENVQYMPTLGRYKVYLIDEVHMLTAHSFNALLKTLEEPPPHVKFLLATTDPQKLPATVLSRCLQFSLRRLPVALISERLRGILEAEAIEAEPAALRLLAVAADGSLRDALSLLDQLIAFGGGRVAEADARAMLGTIDREHVVRIAELLAAQDAAGLMQYAGSLEQWAPDHAQVLDELAALLQRVALSQVVRDYEGDETHPPELLQRLAGALAPEDVQLFYQTAIIGRRDLAWAPDGRTGFEMTLLRMLAFRPAVQPAPPAGTRTATGAPAPGSAAAPPAGSGGAAGASLEPSGWAGLVQQLDLQGAARQLAANCALLSREKSRLRLALEPRHRFMRTRATEERLAQALARRLGEPVRLEFEVIEVPAETPARADERAAAAELDAARASFERDPTVQALKERFGASSVPDSVQPAR